MASRIAFASLFMVVFAIGVKASDPELTSDYTAPLAGIDGTYFKSTVLKGVPVTSARFATVTGLNQNNFPALVGLGVSSALLQFPPGSINPVHYHPRASEVFYVLQGCLDVGFVDTMNKLFTATICEGESFVFPKAMTHFQINRGLVTAKGIVAFSSSNPGTSRLPNVLFKSGIPDDVLMQSFGAGKLTINLLKFGIVN
ncbi:protein MpCupin60 [Marchantia polymorpha subsp. ruderalis]|nr:hypothetical protein MARPO_0193s0020 [Marchantia polymorpha]BBN10077.1 hypothetical protein Mp_5g00720 [Marchantia polymorpha subsp. ruderalis]|eukprot:PTQ27556.1 hypothetical protein MARPO_0193s0020 [Marchantia polymorpha]